MLDLIEGAKIVNAVLPSTGTNAAMTGDYINMEHLHRVWAIVNWEGGDTSPDITFKLASAYAGTGSSTAGTAKWWISTVGTTIYDRFTRSTATSYVAKAELGTGTTSYTIVGAYDPASAASSNTHVAIQFGARNGMIAATYVLDSRYKGSQQFLATTATT